MNKKMCIAAKCGTKEKKVTFPVTEEIEQWMKNLSHNLEDELHYEVEGGASVKITISIFNYSNKF